MADGFHLSSSSRILLTNDDGINAEGLKVLEKVARKISDDVWVVAPKEEQSGVSHALSLHRPLRLYPAGERRFIVDGTPSDAVFIALRHLFKDKKPDLVLSGFNQGANLCVDVIYSGTVAAAMEAALMDIPALALSQLMGNNHSFDFEGAAHILPLMLKNLSGFSFAHNTVLNVNFPPVALGDMKTIALCRQGNHHRKADIHECRDPRGAHYFWIGLPFEGDETQNNTDLAAVRRGDIAMTPLTPDWTSHQGMAELKDFIPRLLV